MAEKAKQEAKAALEAQAEEARRKNQSDPKPSLENLTYEQMVDGMNAYLDSAEGQQLMKEASEIFKYVPSRGGSRGHRGGGKGQRDGRGGHKRGA